MALTNTHFYDGQLKERLKELGPHLQRARSIPRERKLKAFAEIEGMLYSGGCARINLRTIANYARSGGSNFDPSNGYDAIDVLWLCYELVCLKKDDVLPILAMQLEDVSQGQCPQGRTHRLLQVVCPFQEYLPA